MPNKRKTISRDEAVRRLSEQTHLTKLQIDQFIGRSSEVGEDTVQIAIKVSERQEKQLRTKVFASRKRANSVQSARPGTKLPSTRLSIQDATKELADFTQSMVQ